uniref:Uncharacterized protein n=1 Tax=Arundo donax TaxID=35708 RepID=A0A0A8YRI0_ARUDO
MLRRFFVLSQASSLIALESRCV